MLVFGCCNKKMQARIKESPNFESTVQNDPNESLKIIKTKMRDPSRTKCKHATLMSALRTSLKCHQTDEEDLLACTQRFKQCSDTLKSAVRDKLLHEFVTHTKEHKDETDSGKRNEIAKRSLESWMTHSHVSHANWNKCRSLSDGFNTQCSLENDQLPRQ